MGAFMDINSIVSKTSKELLEGHREKICRGKGNSFPNVEAIVEILRKLRTALFPEYFSLSCTTTPQDVWLHSLLTSILWELTREINTVCDSSEAPEKLIGSLVDIQALLCKDAEAGFEGDPAAQGVGEVILTYPGFYAVFVHRIANFLSKEGVPIIPRIMSEHAHSRTGIDIHPGAEIGEFFFIDHGTGVVIGETTVIGDHVKIYQGVTLGALSTRGGQRLAGKKRHPTVEDNVTIYAGATILGGETVIGRNSTIGGNVFLINSVPQDSRVSGE